ncbi:MAG: hypothetical protein QXO84_00225 [Candidatus Aenigmatarchaeota archaeon]
MLEYNQISSLDPNKKYICITHKANIESNINEKHALKKIFYTKSNNVEAWVYEINLMEN